MAFAIGGKVTFDVAVGAPGRVLQDTGILLEKSAGADLLSPEAAPVKWLRVKVYL